MTTKRKYGRIPSPPDKRDSRYLLRAQKTKRKKRYWASPNIVLDQKATPRCVGYSTSHLLLASPIRQYVDPDGLYQGCKLIDGEPDEEGTWVRTAFEILRKAGLVSEYRWARTLGDLIYTVLEVGPVVVGTNWYESMETPVKGVITIGYDCWSLGGHAWLIDGVDTVKELFRMKNSWGRDWGNNGRALISFDDMERLIKEEGEIALAVEVNAYLELMAKQ